MNKKKITFEFSIYDSFDDLSAKESHLMKTAIEARKNAYAPYSSFLVGAAILLENAISAASKTHKVREPAAPCGNCRQSISEYEHRQEKPISIFMMGETGKILKSDSIANLLPLAFDGSLL